MIAIGGDGNANLNYAQKMIDAAASNNADVILLSEAIDLGWNGIGCSLVIDPKRVKSM